MNREEKSISPGAAHLFRYYRQIGFDAGWNQGVFIGCFLGGFGILGALFLIGVIHAVN